MDLGEVGEEPNLTEINTQNPKTQNETILHASYLYLDGGENSFPRTCLPLELILYP